MSKKQHTCKACNGYEFSLNDGFMFCDRCGTLLENFEELEEEEGGIQQTLGAGKVKVKKTSDGPKKKRPGNVNFDFIASHDERAAKNLEKRTDFLKDQIRKGEDLPFNQTPDYLYSVGLRIFSFTQILSKSASILVTEMNFDASIKENALAVFQRYLVHCQVAFCSDEQCGADESLRFVAVMENVFYEEEEREEKRRKKLERRGKGVQALSKSAAAWQLLTQGNITEHLDLESDDEDDVENALIEVEEEDEERDEEVDANGTSVADLTANLTNLANETNVGEQTMGFVRKVTTALSKDALRRASQILLNLEILVAILHSTMMCSGYPSVMVSDVVRWIREDRFRISRKSLSLLKCGTIEGTNTVTSSVDIDFQLKFPLYEIMRTSAIFQQSVNLTAYQNPESFGELAARIIDNMNLPVDILNRVLLLESIAPCDVDPTMRRQADVRVGHNCRQLASVPRGQLNSAFMASFGRKERSGPSGDSDEVLLSPETKIMAYILLALKLTFDIDGGLAEPNSDEEDVAADDSAEDDDSDVEPSTSRPSSHHFDIDTWIHQLEMRIKCWQGHDMTMVLRPYCPIPEMCTSLPFGDNYLIKHRSPMPNVARVRRQLGFRQCIPTEMSFHSTSNLPTVFDLRENRYRAERNRDGAILAPLKFQTTVLQREIDTTPNKFKFSDPLSRRTFFKDFRNFQSTDDVEHFQEFFPFASDYSRYARPEWIFNCTARETKRTPLTGPLRIFLSHRATEDLLGVASPSFSGRFRFLLRSLSLLIGEDEKAVYAAFVMLETLIVSPEDVATVRSDLISSSPIPIDGVVYGKSLKTAPAKYGIVSTHPVDQIDQLRYFALSERFFDQPELATEIEDIEFLKFSRNRKINGSREDGDDSKTVVRKHELGHNFAKFYSVLAVKMW